MSIRTAAAEARRLGRRDLLTHIESLRWRYFMRAADGELNYFEQLQLTGVQELTEDDLKRLRDLEVTPAVTRQDRDQLLDLTKSLPPADQRRVIEQMARPALSRALLSRLRAERQSGHCSPRREPRTPFEALEFIYELQEHGRPTLREWYPGEDEEEPDAAL